MRAFAKCVAVVILLVATFFAGRWSTAKHFPPVILRDDDTERDVRRFEALVQATKHYLVSHDGWLPADPYRALIESGELESFQAFFVDGIAIEFQFNDLPPRLNTDLARNRKFALFWIYDDEIHEAWICCSDGTWKRYPTGVQPEWNTPSNTSAWSHDLRLAGYPYWMSIPDKSKWIDAHRNALVWDASQGMYGVSDSK